jgi:hypothetical protein
VIFDVSERIAFLGRGIINTDIKKIPLLEGTIILYFSPKSEPSILLEGYFRRIIDRKIQKLSSSIRLRGPDERPFLILCVNESSSLNLREKSIFFREEDTMVATSLKRSTVR